MNRASDIERMLAHIGDPEMRYQEFEAPRSEARARADWSLLDSAAGGKGGQPVVPEAAPMTPTIVPPADPARPSYVERELVVPDATAPDAGKDGLPPAGAPPGEARGQLQRVFARLRGEPPPPAAPVPPSPKRDTPLSQIFRRLS
ncbi:MAG: hypothetical protein ACK4QW_17045 [Alphaproteobacteria bacterium]